MRYYDEQTALDLEFDQVRKLLGAYCLNYTAKYSLERLRPYSSLKQAEESINQSAELLSIRKRSMAFPRLEFEELDKEIRLLAVSSSILQLDGIVRIWDASQLVNSILLFFAENGQSFPLLHGLSSPCYLTEDIDKAIDKVIDKRLKVKDDATPELLEIRNRIKTLKRQVNRNFEKAVRKAKASGFIGDISENVIENRRVLTVMSTYKRQVDGRLMGSSKTGSLSYIEPKENEALNAELDQLYDDEQREIKRIFKELTDFLRQYLPLIEAYQRFLVKLDEVQAKVKLAEKIKANKPLINAKDQSSFLHEAFHPLLLLKNMESQQKTYPQSFNLDEKRRLLVISGPNAGGKSITLKTMGLLQLMFQSGLLIPASPKSKLAWFDYILSDIGDNQSIENQLSTYSYRLQRMKFFLGKLGPKTLLLLDEFGTGSDPDLGGALAEVFFEHLYKKGAYGVITTHYSNIKLRAAKMDQAQNANMLFNKETLEPEYQLEIGQPGSSFTFEVAEMNGIPKELIEAAKSKIDSKKLDLDYLIADLQKDKSEIHQLKSGLIEESKEANEARERFESKEAHYKLRLETLQKRIEDNNKYLAYGKKMDQYLSDYLKSNKKQKPQVIEELKKFLLVEESKIQAERAKSRAKKKVNQNKASASNKKKAVNKAEELIKTGDTVRLKNTRQSGQVLSIENNEATVAFGNFKTLVNLSRLALIGSSTSKKREN